MPEHIVILAYGIFFCKAQACAGLKARYKPAPFCLQKIHKIEGPFSVFEGRIEVRDENQTKRICPLKPIKYGSPQEKDCQRAAWENYARTTVKNTYKRKKVSQ